MLTLLDPSARLLVAHRGGAWRAPENTLAAFERVRSLPVDGVEFDVRLTADGAVVVHHDAALGRTSDGRGPIASLPLAAIREADAGARFSVDGGRTHPFAGRGLRVPTLDEVLETLPRTLPLVVELKCAAVAQPARTVLSRHGALGRLVVGSFVPGALAAFGGGVPRTASRPEAVGVLARVLTGRASARPPAWDVLSVTPRYWQLPIPVARMARWAATAGRVTQVWTVNDPVQATRYWAAGVQCVLSDDPDTLLAAPRG